MFAAVCMSLFIVVVNFAHYFDLNIDSASCCISVSKFGSLHYHIKISIWWPVCSKFNVAEIVLLHHQNKYPMSTLTIIKKLSIVCFSDYKSNILHSIKAMFCSQYFIPHRTCTLKSVAHIFKAIPIHHPLHKAKPTHHLHTTNMAMPSTKWF